MASTSSPFEGGSGEEPGQVPPRPPGGDLTSPESAARLRSRHPSGADVFYLPRYPLRIGTSRDVRARIFQQLLDTVLAPVKSQDSKSTLI